MTRLLPLALLALLAFGPPGEALAQEAAAPTPADEALQLAVQDLQEGRLAEAIDRLAPLVAAGDAPPHVAGLLGSLYLEAEQPAEALAVLAPLVAASPDPGGLYNAGRAALALGRTADAEAFFSRSLQIEPGTPAARELGLLWGQQGRVTDAYRLLRTWAQTHPEDREARLVAALLAVKLQRAPEAEAFLSDLPQADPRVRLLWGKVLLMKGDPHASLATLKPLLGGDDAQLDLDVRRTMAEAYMITGQAAEAAALVEGPASRDPALALILAKARHQAGDIDAALATLAPVAPLLLADEPPALAPGQAAAMALEYGRLLVTAVRHEEAVPYLELATRLDPEGKLGWQYLGQSLAAVGRREEARAALDRFQAISQNEIPAAAKDTALERDMTDPTGRELREALRLLAEDRGEDALAVVRQEASLAPEDPRPRLVEARILLALERQEEALAVAEDALALAPENPDTWYQKGVVHMARGELDRGEEDLRRALALAPGHTAALNDLAVLLMSRGDAQEARDLLERVLELRPDDPVAQRNLQRLQGGG